MTNRWWSTAAAASLLVACGPAEEEPAGSDAPIDVTLADPAPDGFQLSTGEFEVPRGTEVQNCYFFEVPFDEPVFVNRITLAQNDGSHHMNVFRVRSIVNLDGAPGEVVEDGQCWESANWADWPLVANTQQAGVEDWQMPDGVALRLEAHEKIMMQSHYVNASTQQTPAKAKVLANFYAVPESEVHDELGTLFASNQSIRVCPGDTGKRFEASCKLATEGPVKVIAANGHFHSRGDLFTISAWDQFAGAAPEPFYFSESWDDPPLARGLEVAVPDGGGINWACEFSATVEECGDPEDGCCFTFGGYVEYQEHCNAFVYYYPRGNTDVNCF